MAKILDEQAGAMSPRVVLPGAVLAVALTAGALLALALVFAMRGDGPFNLGLGDSDGLVRLPEREVASAPRPATLPAGAPSILLPSGVLVPAVDLAPAGDGGLRGDARVRERAGRRRAATPGTPTPAGTPAPASPAPITTTRPAATPPPNPVVVKERGRGTPQPAADVPTKRVASRPAPGVATPEATPSAPVPTVEMRTYQPPPADTGVGAEDGVLERVPAPQP